MTIYEAATLIILFATYNMSLIGLIVDEVIKIIVALSKDKLQ